MTTDVLRFADRISPATAASPFEVQLREFSSLAGFASVKEVMGLLTTPVTILSENDSQKMRQQRLLLALPLIERIAAFSRPATFYQVDEVPPISPLVRNEAANLALVVAEVGLGQTQNDRVVMPSVHPTAAGAIQFEWHRNGVDLEIEIHPSGEISAYVEELDKEPVELLLSSGLQAVDTVLNTVLLR